MTEGTGTERTLVLLRHAKAESPPGVADAERPLAVRGRADAFAAGAWLADHGYLPTVVICSPAARTRQTWHGVALGLSGGADRPAVDVPVGGPEVRYEPTAYAASPAELLELVRAVDRAVSTVLLVAHNPGVSLLSGLLDPGRVDETGLRTAGLAVHRVRAAWADLGPGAAPLVRAHTARR
ncbi:SixA phosphatase family protein [Micromonospora echinofusca]|uniref:Histidine phosphatase family protein n=1 Tax=Micromonospora echinofusca TaxID=47858 RepID=A0ABS3VMW0_MICEH|nr:histidine phosphatase family protein [Micromonospora echinofusca]MBO4205860.1 histidine phosphatase family protein [Micromonospora echinofusca]